MADFLVRAWPYAAAVLVILGAVALIALIVVLVRAAKTMQHVNAITEEAEKELTPALKRVDPLVDRAELTVDTLNLELLRIDAILEDVEQVTDVAGKTANTVDVVTSAPTNAVVSLAERIRGAIGSKHKDKVKEGRVVYPIGSGADDGAEAGTTPTQDAAEDPTPAQGAADEAAAEQPARSPEAAQAAEGPAVSEQVPAQGDPEAPAE